MRNTMRGSRLLRLYLPLIVITIMVALLAAFEPALAQDAAPARPPLGELLRRMLPMFVMVTVIMYLMVVRPQQQKLKTQQELLSTLKKDDEVVSTSGIIGRVAGVEKDYILVEVSKGVRLKFEAAHIVRRVEEPKPAQSAAS